MKLHMVFLILLCGVMAAVPAIAQQNLYDNGPVNGQDYAWVLNFGFTVSNSFQIPDQYGDALNGVQFWVWLGQPYDIVNNIEVQIGQWAFGNLVFDQFVNLTQSNCFLNNYGSGYEVCLESGNFPTIYLNGGNYWLTLGNASVDDGDPVYWDENSGVGCTSPGCPSAAQMSSIGTIPSEAFTLLGNVTTTSCRWCGFTPEPGSIVLFGSGVLGLAGMLRLKGRR